MRILVSISPSTEYLKKIAEPCLFWGTRSFSDCRAHAGASARCWHQLVKLSWLECWLPQKPPLSMRDKVRTVGCWLTNACHPNPMGKLCVRLGRGCKDMHDQCVHFDMVGCACIVSICGNSATFWKLKRITDATGKGLPGMHTCEVLNMLLLS